MCIISERSLPFVMDDHVLRSTAISDTWFQRDQSQRFRSIAKRREDGYGARTRSSLATFPKEGLAEKQISGFKSNAESAAAGR